MATLIRATGGVEEITPEGDVFTLGELQALVGGYLEGIPVPDGRTMYLNEEGKLKGLPLNREATVRVAHWLMPGDWICGDVVLCTRGETGDEEAGEPVEA